MLNLVCLGNVTIDDVVLFDGTTGMGSFGGDTIFAALSASLWSDAIQFVAPIGDDYPPENLAALQKRGWGAQCMPTRPVPTHRNWVIYEEDGRRTWVLRTNPDDFYLLSPLVEDIPAAFRQAKAFLILAMDLAAQENLVAGLQGGEAWVALDPQEDNIPGNEERFMKMLRGVDIFLPSEIEVERLLGHKDYARAARQFSELGCKITAIKLGDKGSLVYDARTDQFYEIPIFRAQVVDTTGAGDSYSGGFMSQFVGSQNLLHSGLAGSVSASFCVEGFGITRLLEITPQMAQARFAQLLSQVQE